MQVIRGSNINELYYLGLMHFSTSQFAGPQASRYGHTLEAHEPVLSITDNPRQRVLFDTIRNANPFFHLIEAVWILAGRRDVAPLAKVLPRMAEFSDDGHVFHAAYGERLLHPIDQVALAIRELKQNPDSRRVVLQIWDKSKDLSFPSKDIPCNDLVFLKIREGKLHLRVMCRSNDMLWGAYGANTVQFSMLQEFIANALGVEVGTMTQYSDSFHVYTAGAGGALWERVKNTWKRPEIDDYALGRAQSYPRILDSSVGRWREEANEVLDMFLNGEILWRTAFKNSFFPDIVLPMMAAWLDDSSDTLPLDYDWHTAGCAWLARRHFRRGR